mmetsp:Transcript_8937/g.16567  ORF Transcript_8937/g.16567 Transcript_8937/m.16567 type:complete len:196 (+) Transcript_8937:71-658(+)
MQRQRSPDTMPTLSSNNHNNANNVACIANNTATSENLHPLAYTILWSPLPPITIFFPFIGHMGIATSKGVACDFQGPYAVGDRGRMAFGQPTRALRIDVSSLPGGAEQWDEAIMEANAEYRTRMHNICCDNCHSHVAYALNFMEISGPYGIRNWDMVKLCFLVFFKGRFLGVGGFLRQFLPFGIMVLIWVVAKAI